MKPNDVMTAQAGIQKLAALRWIPAFAGMALLAACSGIGKGSTVQSLKLVFSPTERDQAVVVDKDLSTQTLRVFDCFCSNLIAVGTFTDGTLANFNLRAKWSSNAPSVVAVANFSDAGTFTQCPLVQRTAGMLVPQGAGTAVISAEFLGFKADYTVNVRDTAAEAPGSFLLKPFDATNSGEVAVGALLPLQLTATLDGRPRALNLNGTYALKRTSDSADVTTVATIDAIGRVAGLSPDLGGAMTATASFGTCNVTATLPIRVGEPVAPITLSEETGLAPDQKLAVNTNENLKVVATLDFGAGGATGSQRISDSSAVNFTDPCTLRTFDDVTPTGPGTSCRETSTAACASSLPLCATSTDTLCTTGMAACRTVAAPMTASLNRIVAIAASSSPTTFFATYPASFGTATKIPDPLAAGDTSLTVAALVNYPAVFPFEGVIDKGLASEEIVQVTARGSGTLMLTVVRGYSGTTAQAHGALATFVQRSFTTSTLDLTAVGGVLTTFSIDLPVTLPLYQSVQLTATGTFDDGVTPRTQNVAHQSAYAVGSPGIIWTSSKQSVATVTSSSGLVESFSPCGGTTVIRARARSSTDTAKDDDVFAKPDPAALGVDDTDANGNTDANDTACTTTDALCDQVNLMIPRASPLPPGYTTAYCDAL